MSGTSPTKVKAAIAAATVPLKKDAFKPQPVPVVVGVPTPPTGEGYLTVEQLATLLQVKPTTVYEWTRRRGLGRIPCYRLGKKTIRFKWSEVDVWIREGKAAA